MIFEVGRRYSRADVKEVAGLNRNAKGGPWDTGIVEHDGEFFIFTNVGTGGRTGHNYDNRWEGELLRWFHKNGSHMGWPSVRRLIGRGSIVHLFWRNSNKLPFEYAGRVKPIKIIEGSPVTVLWSSVNNGFFPGYFIGPDEIDGQFKEGKVRRVQVNAYERDRAARWACIEHYGPVCSVCGFVFEEIYGSIGTGYIHVHHLVPISQIGAEYNVDPIEDLRPICPNCHAMVHMRKPPFSIGEVNEMLGR